MSTSGTTNYFNFIININIFLTYAGLNIFNAEFLQSWKTQVKKSHESYCQLKNHINFMVINRYIHLIMFCFKISLIVKPILQAIMKFDLWVKLFWVRSFQWIIQNHSQNGSLTFFFSNHKCPFCSQIHSSKRVGTFLCCLWCAL